MKLLIGLCSVIMTYAVWYLAEPLGFMWAFFLSSLGSLLGVYLGWRLARHFGL
ncbi:MAG: hypothetical protein JF599_12045 [Verrucomicrobia bacterium]|nr:hypothetical protein [Verrucomicrobiota bacterium]